MKHFYAAAAMLAAISMHAQCPPGGVTFTSQTQINNFIIQYPDCTEINGDVSIEGDIQNLNGLANIVTISGALEIREVDDLESLDGLENLETLGTDLVLREVNDLEDISALMSLTSVGGELTIRECPELIDLDGLENLTTVGLGLIVRQCESLVSIESLTSVTYVGEILEVVDCPLLSSLAGLENITTIIGGDEGALVIEGNDSLTSLEGFGNDQTVMTGGVTISTNGELSYCSVPAICNYLQNPPEGAATLIGLNVTGCNSDTEVIAACAPPAAPAVTSFTPESGCPGSEIIITGTGFTSVTSVTIGGVEASYTVHSSTEIIVTVGNTTGVISVTNITGTTESESIFTVTPPPAAPAGETAQAITVHNTAEATIEDLVYTLEEGGTIQWYASEEDALSGEDALAPGTVLTAGATYYATQTIDGCTSIELLAVTVDILLGAGDFDVNGFSYYPVPVKNELNLSYSSDITLVTVTNLLGQQVLSKKPATTNTAIDMSTLSSGMYIVKATSGNAAKTFKVIKE